MSRNRIWELDALRGICITGMVAVHLLYDLNAIGPHTPVLSWIQHWGGTLFLLISGVCVTLGSRHIRRSLIVFGCGMICTVVTAGMYVLGIAEKGIVIYFGVLHCLGACMLTWSLLRHCPNGVLAVLGSIFCIAGLHLERTVIVSHPFLIPFGFLYPGFSSSDYFPLLPYLGFFLLGALIGRTLYKEKCTRFPNFDPKRLPIGFFCQCGVYSLPIYLLHQPLLTVLLTLVSAVHP